MSGAGALEGSWNATGRTFFLDLRRMTEVKFPNMEGCFGGGSETAPAREVEYVRDNVEVSDGFSLASLGEDFERDHQ